MRPITPYPFSPPVHAREGSLIIIPREGDQLVRFYTELPGTAAAADLRLEDLQARVRLILRPYEFEVAGTAWWSAYAVGQRCAERFAEAQRVFLTGDAGHTHSPKAGQGMNVSLQDGYNLGWKLAAVLRGRAAPALLGTYVAEREKTAPRPHRLRPPLHQPLLDGLPSRARRHARRLPRLLHQGRPLHRRPGLPVRGLANRFLGRGPSAGRGRACRHAVPQRAGRALLRRESDGFGQRAAC